MSLGCSDAFSMSLRHRPRGGDSFQHLARRWLRDERGDRWRRCSWLYQQTSRDALVFDGLISHVTVTDREHALYGQRLELVSLHSSRGRDFIVVALPNGRHRSLRRSQTDLVPSQAQAAAPAPDLLVDVEVLLTLMRHLRRSLSFPSEEEICDEQESADSRHKRSETSPRRKGCTACMAKPASSGNEATCTHLCQDCEATSGTGRKSAEQSPC